MPSLITSPGIYRDFDGEAYFADPCETPSFTQSLAKILIEQSPLHAKMAHPRLAPPVEGEEDAEKYDKAKAIGNMAHGLAIGRGKVMEEIDAKNFTTKAAKEAKQSALEMGREPILRKHVAVARVMHGALMQQLGFIEGCAAAFVHGDGEVVVANCENGLWLRSMIDWLTPDLREVWDLKTTGMSASPYAAGKMMANAGWHIQAAMHERILNALDPAGAGRRRYRYVVQENEPPFALCVSEIGEDALTIGRKQLDYAIMMWRDCMETGVWPAYPQRIIRPELPGYFADGWIAREVREEEEREYRPRPSMLANLAGG